MARKQSAVALEQAASSARRAVAAWIGFIQVAVARSAFWACAGSLALAALFGHLTLQHLTAGIVGGRYDGYENLWNDYWLRTALFHFHQNPFFSTWIEYPTGASLRFHTLDPFGGVLALPLSPLLGGIAAMNIKRR